MPYLSNKILIHSIVSQGMIQSKWKFNVSIPYVPYQGPNMELTFLARSTNIPASTREKEVIITSYNRFTVPHRIEYEHEWSVTVFLAESDSVWGRLAIWFGLLDSVALADMKTTATVSLTPFNGIGVTKMAIMKGIYPLSIPAIEDLDQESNEGLVSFEAKFAYDSITYI